MKSVCCPGPQTALTTTLLWDMLEWGERDAGAAITDVGPGTHGGLLTPCVICTMLSTSRHYTKRWTNILGRYS